MVNHNSKQKKTNYYLSPVSGRVIKSNSKLYKELLKKRFIIDNHPCLYNITSAKKCLTSILKRYRDVIYFPSSLADIPHTYSKTNVVTKFPVEFFPGQPYEPFKTKPDHFTARGFIKNVSDDIIGYVEKDGTFVKLPEPIKCNQNVPLVVSLPTHNEDLHNQLNDPQTKIASPNEVKIVEKQLEIPSLQNNIKLLHNPVQNDIIPVIGNLTPEDHREIIHEINNTLIPTQLQNINGISGIISNDTQVLGYTNKDNQTKQFEIPIEIKTFIQPEIQQVHVNSEYNLPLTSENNDENKLNLLTETAELTKHITEMKDKLTENTTENTTENISKNTDNSSFEILTPTNNEEIPTITENSPISESEEIPTITEKELVSSPTEMSSDDQITEKELVSSPTEMSSSTEMSSDDQITEKELVSSPTEMSSDDQITEKELVSSPTEMSSDDQITEKELVSSPTEISTDDPTITEKELVSSPTEISTDDPTITEKELVSSPTEMSSDDPTITEKELVSSPTEMSSDDQITEKELVSSPTEMSRLPKVEISEKEIENLPIAENNEKEKVLEILTCKDGEQFDSNERICKPCSDYKLVWNTDEKKCQPMLRATSEIYQIPDSVESTNYSLYEIPSTATSENSTENSIPPPPPNSITSENSSENSEINENPSKNFDFLSEITRVKNKLKSKDEQKKLKEKSDSDSSLIDILKTKLSKISQSNSDTEDEQDSSEWN
jgi:hypothetical protein